MYLISSDVYFWHDALILVHPALSHFLLLTIVIHAAGSLQWVTYFWRRKCCKWRTRWWPCWTGSSNTSIEPEGRCGQWQAWSFNVQKEKTIQATQVTASLPSSFPIPSCGSSVNGKPNVCSIVADTSPDPAPPTKILATTAWHATQIITKLN